jgi:hypothetical protein
MTVLTSHNEAFKEVVAILRGSGADPEARRLIAADRADDAGLDQLARRLRRTESRFAFFEGSLDRTGFVDEDDGKVRVRCYPSTWIYLPLPLAAIDLLKRLRKTLGNRGRSLTLHFCTKLQLGREGSSYREVWLSNPEAARSLTRGPDNGRQEVTAHLEARYAVSEIDSRSQLILHLHPDDDRRFGVVLVPSPAQDAREALEERLRDEVLKALPAVWGAISPDVDQAAREFPGEYDPIDLDGAVEICLDADHPVVHGGMSKEDYAALCELDHNTVNEWGREALRGYF